MILRNRANAEADVADELNGEKQRDAKNERHSDDKKESAPVIIKTPFNQKLLCKI